MNPSSHQSSFILFLEEEFKARKARNPRYSLRAFAKALSIEASILTRIMNGTRKLTPTLADRLLRNLRIDPAKKSLLLLGILTSPFDPEATIQKKKRITEDESHFLNSWEHFAVLSLFDLKGFRSNEKWMARTLGVAPSLVAKTLKDLERIGLIDRTTARWKLNESGTFLPEKTSPAVVRKIHREYLAIAADSMENRAYDECDISGITLAISKDRLSEAFRRIKEFRRSLADYLSAEGTGNLDEVYRIGVQLFPVRVVAGSDVSKTRDQSPLRSTEKSPNAGVYPH